MQLRQPIEEFETGIKILDDPKALEALYVLIHKGFSLEDIHDAMSIMGMATRNEEKGKSHG